MHSVVFPFPAFPRSNVMVREQLGPGRMFGSQFWSYSVICGTQWGYDSWRIEMRNSSDYNEETWTSQINKLLTGLQGNGTLRFILLRINTRNNNNMRIRKIKLSAMYRRVGLVHNIKCS